MAKSSSKGVLFFLMALACMFPAHAVPTTPDSTRDKRTRALSFPITGGTSFSSLHPVRLRCVRLVHPPVDCGRVVIPVFSRFKLVRALSSNKGWHLGDASATEVQSSKRDDLFDN